MKKSLAEMAEEVYAVNEANGWFETERSFDDDVALLHTEIGETFDAYRSHGFADATAAQGKPIYGNGEDAFGNYTEVTGFALPKPEGVGSELADILIRLLDTAKRRGWNLAEIQRLESATEIRRSHPFSHSVNRMHHWTDDLLYGGGRSAGVLRDWLLLAVEQAGVDLDFEYERKLAYNRTRGHRHGGKLL